jgi:hypothetical protein
MVVGEVSFLHGPEHVRSTISESPGVLGFLLDQNKYLYLAML